MLKLKELSAFQKNMNYLTLYLFLMRIKCKNLKDYDDEGEFEFHNYFFNLCREKLNHKILEDNNLLINQPVFNSFFSTISDKNEKRTQKLKLKKDKLKYLCDLYFEYSKSLPKSRLRHKSYYLITWSLFVILFIILMFLMPTVVLQEYIFSIFEELHFEKFYIHYGMYFCVLIISFYCLIKGIILRHVLNSNNNSKIKFDCMFSNDYCYKRLKEAESFFRTHYNVENDYLELSEIEKKFPEKNNMFYNTIQKTKLNEDSKKKLLKINENIYCRAVFSDLFNLIIKDKKIEQLQQIPFVFITCKTNAKVDIKGNTGFAECINTLLEKSVYYDTTFNQAIPKLTNPKTDILPKYLNIFEKYENILQ